VKDLREDSDTGSLPVDPYDGQFNGVEPDQGPDLSVPDGDGQ
jgi:hypothetical protein